MNKLDESAKIETRMFRKQGPYFQLVHTWWQERFACDFPLAMATNYGFMATVNKHPVLAMFYYPTIGSEMCMLGWPISNPTSSPEQRKACIDAVVARIEREAKNMGYKFISSYPSTGVVVDHMTRLGYINAEPCTAMHKKL